MKKTYGCPFCKGLEIVKSPWSPKGLRTHKYRSIWFCRRCEQPFIRRVAIIKKEI